MHEYWLVRFVSILDVQGRFEDEVGKLEARPGIAFLNNFRADELARAHGEE